MAETDEFNMQKDELCKYDLSLASVVLSTWCTEQLCSEHLFTKWDNIMFRTWPGYLRLGDLENAID